MSVTTRREFLGGFGRGALCLGLGPSLVPDFLARVVDDDRLDFGELEPLVSLMQETPPDRLLELLVQRLQAGAELQELVAAGALANARTFGGQNYNGYHAFMALIPAWEMAQLSPRGQRALPVLKVLYRNASFMQDSGGRTNEVLRRVEAMEAGGGAELLAAERGRDMDGAERVFAAVCRRPAREAYEQLQPTIRDDIDVHRIVLAWRSWDMLRLVGEKHAPTLLRQPLRHCVQAEDQRFRRDQTPPSLRDLLPALLERLARAKPATGAALPDDALLEELSEAIFAGSREQAATAMASALEQGHAPADLAESLSLAANRLLLQDSGRTDPEPGKPVGSVHGASIGVHASDAACAWRNLAGVLGANDCMASLVAAAYHTGGQSRWVGSKALDWSGPREELGSLGQDELLRALAPAVEARDQARACAVVERLGELGASERAVFDLLQRYATSEDGALHAEKYFSTVHQEFGRARPAFRWRHMVGLARVTASECGFPAPGVAAARELLGA